MSKLDIKGGNDVSGHNLAISINATIAVACVRPFGVTADTVREAGWELDEVLPVNERLTVRRTANLHTGGTICDVTDEVNPTLARVAIDAADAIGIPVTGIDLMVPAVDGEEYVFIEANERPGLANHEPRPTAKAFVDLLFPRTAATPWAWQPEPVDQG